MEMTTVKTIGVMSIIFGCFAVLYPKIFHPMLMQAAGAENGADSTVNQGPPSRPGLGSGRPTPSSASDDMHKHMRPGPHPGMRAAAEMKKQASSTQGGGGGKGMMGMVLPMYAVGIVIYLIYTMSKVFGKRDQKAGDDYLNNHFADVRYDADRQRFGAGKSDNDNRKKKGGERDLERLLLKADHNKINESEVEELKRRLVETEAQMSRLLESMGSVSSQVDSTIGNIAGDDDTSRAEASADGQKKTVDSSPDQTESYELISGLSSPDADYVKDFPDDDDHDHDGNALSSDGDAVERKSFVEELPVSGDLDDSEKEVSEDDAEDQGDEEEADEGEEIMLEDEEEEEDAHPDLRKRTCQTSEEKH